MSVTDVFCSTFDIYNYVACIQKTCAVVCITGVLATNIPCVEYRSVACRCFSEVVIGLAGGRIRIY